VNEAQDKYVRYEILDLLSLLQGVAHAAKADTSSRLFDYLAPFLAGTMSYQHLFVTIIVVENLEIALLESIFFLFCC